MIPVLYKPDESNFDTDGIGSLTDALTCTITEERNGPYELEMTYPLGGQLYDSIKNQCVIKAKPNDTANLQLFRVYKVTKPINQICTVYAEHISYELAGNPVLDFNCSGNAGAVLSALLDRAIFAHKFTVASDITGSNTVKFVGPHNVREIMGGTDGSVLDTFGGEYEWDNYMITLHAHRGHDNGVTVEYGKNLTDLTQEETIDSTYTCVVPYVKTSSDGVDTYHYLSSKYVNAPNADKFARPKALMVDFSDKFNTDSSENSDKPTFSESLLQQYAEQYIKSNDVGVPKVSLTIKYVPLWMLPEYAGNPLLERVSLCDAVTVRFARLGVGAKARVNKITYNVLQERVEEAELGDAKSNFVDSYAKLEQRIENVPKDVKSIVSGEVGTATSLLTGAKGGHVVIKTDANKKPQEILIMDTEDSSTAVNVWRWNVNGFGHSGSGINGPYDTAITIDGKIIGKFIYALSIYGSQITAGAIKSVDGNVVFDLDGNQLIIYSSSGKLMMTLNKEALTFYDYITNGQKDIEISHGELKIYEGGQESAFMGGDRIEFYNADTGQPTMLISPKYGSIEFEHGDGKGVKGLIGVDTYNLDGKADWLGITGAGSKGVVINCGSAPGVYFPASYFDDQAYSMVCMGNAKFKSVGADGLISTEGDMYCNTLHCSKISASDGLYRPSSNPIHVMGLNNRMLAITTSEDGRITSCEYA